MSRTPLIWSLLLFAACAPAADETEAPAQEAAEEAEPAFMAELRAATERFQDVEVALAEGYIPDPTGACITAPMEGQPAELGAMGIHYFRPDLLGITATEPRVDGNGTHTDFNQPGVILYEPQADGSLELVAIENLVFQESWHGAGNDGAPVYEGFEYVYMIDDPATDADEAHGFEPHYELHFWLYRDNPNGAFTPFNPAVTCEHAPPMESMG
ncbi:MAG: hypothetical protein JSU98_15365 [Gemmatimonadales bacterium]|jgi:hypothetical protein|nr:MAG: hypothetical protein JSU98_15365 [Gemmatimonadales bacterium]